ncbi:hypothetical protein GRI39_01960 [Altererythrobacter indicus]|uniref:Uncharacterized protein n=1 Tax=Altericroceibacterium indicum TaxID=374177 RepID=A0A845A6Z6_9SPHN|nr:hypothetical protein [Altericroceibacterium indicum]MXP24811.1 hypothetical protein [Altericroceibacterium indicum]
MPQDIPLEASETLAFTPSKLRDKMGENAPHFILRTITSREKRFRRRLVTEAGCIFHTQDAIRNELVNGLKAQWSPDEVDAAEERLRTYWQALDDFTTQAMSDDDVEWSYDSDIEAAVHKLERDVSQNWPPLSRMRADNLEHGEISALSQMAVTLKSWGNMKATPDIDRGFLTLDCVDTIQEELTRIDFKQGIKPGTSLGEVLAECARQWMLDESTAKNSASPSRSDITPDFSTAKDGDTKSGKSPVRARSKKTQKDS